VVGSEFGQALFDKVDHLQTPLLVVSRIEIVVRSKKNFQAFAFIHHEILFTTETKITKTQKSDFPKN
jgi:hypothetical protein